MGKKGFVIGLGIGYVLGTRAGREQYDRIQRAVQGVFGHPWVKDRVQGVEERVDRVAREQASVMTDRVADIVKRKIVGDDDSGTPETSSSGS